METRMILPRLLRVFVPLCAILLHTFVSYAVDPTVLQVSTCLRTAHLIYSDDFDGELDREQWEPRTKTWEIKDGTLIGSPDHKNARGGSKGVGTRPSLGSVSGDTPQPPASEVRPAHACQI